MTLPVLYSLRHCPYAMRARLAIFKSKRPVALRDVVLKNKPTEMIAASPKATVPIVVLASGKVIDESLDVMLWALGENDPDNLLKANCGEKVVIEASDKLTEMLGLINQFDDEFKTCLEAYKCAKRYHEANLEECRQACEHYIQGIESRLATHNYIIDDKESLVDIALLPFIRQFSRVERPWFQQSNYPHVKGWLRSYLQSPMFTKVMAKYPLWENGHEVTVFSG